MILDHLARPTDTMVAGNTVQELFAKCLEFDVSGLPYVDGSGRIVGRLSIRHIFKQTCIPRYILDSAHLLGDDIDEVNIPRQEAMKLLRLTVDPFVLPRFASASPRAPIIKGLAIMEQLSTSYLFIIEGTRYHGIVSRREIASRMITASSEFTL